MQRGEQVADVAVCASPAVLFVYGKTADLRKETDYETRFRCAGGIGILREEVWVNGKDEVVQYNLAFLLPHLSRADKGRVLGFDNAHGTHERHYMGEARTVPFRGYLATAKRFYREAEAIRRSYED
jgi:hypothetical protein